MKITFICALFTVVLLFSGCEVEKTKIENFVFQVEEDYLKEHKFRDFRSSNCLDGIGYFPIDIALRTVNDRGCTVSEIEFDSDGYANKVICNCEYEVKTST